MATAKLGLSLCRNRVIGSKVKVYVNSAFLKNVRFLSTTEKSKDTIVLRPTIKNEGLVYKEQELTDNGFSKINPKNWVSWGPSDESIEEDRTLMHILFFLFISLSLCYGTFIFMYMPDYQYRDWARREGFLELRRREELGLPLIDGNLIPVERIHLPTDEELADTEVLV